VNVKTAKINVPFFSAVQQRGKTMKRFFVFAALCLFAGGVFSANALDLIILRDGNVIEAKVMEISPTEIRYRRADNLNGPLRVIPVASVLSIRYENGTVEQFGGAAAGGVQAGGTGSPGGTSGGAPVPQPGPITPLQAILNTMPAIRIAGNSLKFDFTGDTWTAKVNGENFSTGAVQIEMTGSGAILTLKQTHIWPGAVGKTAGRIAGKIPGGAAVGGALNAAGSVAGLAGAVEAPGREIVLEYRTVPSTKLSLVSTRNTAEKQPRQPKERNQDDSGQGDKPVALKFSLGLVFGVRGEEATVHYLESVRYYDDFPFAYMENHDFSYSSSYLSLIAPMLSLRLLFSLENKLRLGIGTEFVYSLVNVQLTSKNGGYQDVFGYGSFYAILGYSNVFLHAGYDYAFGGLFLAPAWAVTKHLLIGIPMSLFGSNQRHFSVVHSVWSPDQYDERRGHYTEVAKFYYVGLSIQWVF